MANLNEIQRELILSNPNQKEKGYIGLLLKNVEGKLKKTCFLTFGSKEESGKEIKRYAESHDLILVTILTEKEFRDYIKQEEKITKKVDRAFERFYPRDKICVVCGKLFSNLGKTSHFITCSKECFLIRKEKREKRRREIQFD